jgi:hypothetical protein
MFDFARGEEGAVWGPRKTLTRRRSVPMPAPQARNGQPHGTDAKQAPRRDHPGGQPRDMCAHTHNSRSLGGLCMAPQGTISALDIQTLPKD